MNEVKRILNGSARPNDLAWPIESSQKQSETSWCQTKQSGHAKFRASHCIAIKGFGECLDKSINRVEGNDGEVRTIIYRE